VGEVGKIEKGSEGARRPDRGKEQIATEVSTSKTKVSVGQPPGHFDEGKRKGAFGKIKEKRRSWLWENIKKVEQTLKRRAVDRTKGKTIILT